MPSTTTEQWDPYQPVADVDVDVDVDVNVNVNVAEADDQTFVFEQPTHPSDYFRVVGWPSFFFLVFLFYLLLTFLVTLWMISSFSLPWTTFGRLDDPSSWVWLASGLLCAALILMRHYTLFKPFPPLNTRFTINRFGYLKESENARVRVPWCQVGHPRIVKQTLLYFDRSWPARRFALPLHNLSLKQQKQVLKWARSTRDFEQDFARSDLGYNPSDSAIKFSGTLEKRQQLILARQDNGTAGLLAVGLLFTIVGFFFAILLADQFNPWMFWLPAIGFMVLVQQFVSLRWRIFGRYLGQQPQQVVAGTEALVVHYRNASFRYNYSDMTEAKFLPQDSLFVFSTAEQDAKWVASINLLLLQIPKPFRIDLRELSNEQREILATWMRNAGAQFAKF